MALHNLQLELNINILLLAQSMSSPGPGYISPEHADIITTYRPSLQPVAVNPDYCRAEDRQHTAAAAEIPLQISTHQKKGIWRAIAKDIRTLGVYHRRSTHCRKRWEDLRRWSKKTADAQLEMASQRGRGARRTMTLLMFRILAVAYPELDGHLRASQRPQRGEYTLIQLTK
ncbi:hypothetical protein NDU88_006387 [Pleurodeles waltl]|uniref:Myb/SANT-like DNA-binding domain-containing protein n=1 Tax=Pleurodeles waltl TaxID=8319 RepID=A0AAV7WAF8_PLEWA|nr:hypothetical protein NDU88_006387 [Pleurodeles waltl]